MGGSDTYKVGSTGQDSGGGPGRVREVGRPDLRHVVVCRRTAQGVGDESTGSRSGRTPARHVEGEGGKEEKCEPSQTEEGDLASWVFRSRTGFRPRVGHTCLVR